MREFRETISQQDAQAEKSSAWVRVKTVFCGAARFVFLLACLLGTAWLMYQSYPNKSQHFLAWFALAPFIWGVATSDGGLLLFRFSVDYVGLYPMERAGNSANGFFYGRIWR